MTGTSIRSKTLRRNVFTRQMAKIFNDFSVATSLHGYGYLQSANSMTLKFIWILVILIMTGLGVTFVAINTDEYFKARIITNIESSTADLSVSDFLSNASFDHQFFIKLVLFRMLYFHQSLFAI